MTCECVVQGANALGTNQFLNAPSIMRDPWKFLNASMTLAHGSCFGDSARKLRNTKKAAIKTISLISIPKLEYHPSFMDPHSGWRGGFTVFLSIAIVKNLQKAPTPYKNLTKTIMGPPNWGYGEGGCSIAVEGFMFTFYWYLVSIWSRKTSSFSRKVPAGPS